jgi:hypothetical protein
MLYLVWSHIHISLLLHECQLHFSFFFTSMIRETSLTRFFGKQNLRPEFAEELRLLGVSDQGALTVS